MTDAINPGHYKDTPPNSGIHAAVDREELLKTIDGAVR